VLAEATKSQPVRNCSDHGLDCLGRRDDLSASRLGTQTGRGVHRDTDVVPVGDGWSPGVEADPEADRWRRRFPPTQVKLDTGRSYYGICRVLEDGKSLICP
jgi:hypothetical protein